MKLIRSYWDAAREVDPTAPDEVGRFGGQPGELAALWRDVGLHDVVDGSLTVSSRYGDFDELWQTFLEGVGPVGVHAVSLDEARRAAVRDALRQRIGSPEGPFTLTALAWAVVGVV